MKKQFYRVKQLADQAFLKGEKSEILNHEELQIADQKTEFLRGAITSITKKLAPSGPTNDLDKLIKKTFEYQLGTTFVEESRQHQECQLFQKVLKESGLIEQQLAREYAEHEIKVEELVYTPLQNVLENEFPAVSKIKNNLRKYCLDKDSVSSRYNATRKEALKENMEEADIKVEQYRDLLAIEMFNIIAKENEFSEYILQFLKLQRGYHESALKNLETIIPLLEKKIGDSSVRRVFGTSLKEHLRITGKKLAYPLEICITALNEYGMLEEGLFRVAASSSKVKRLKSAIDSGCLSFLIPEYRDAHILASILKLYLRELPEPLLTFHLYNEWIQSMQVPEDYRLEIVKTIIEKLPQENKDNLTYLIQFLSKLTKHPENKMSSSNIAIVLSPNLLWIKNDKENVNIRNCVMINMLIELFIKEVDVLFTEDVSSYVTLSKIFLDEEFLNYSKPDLDTSVESPKPNARKKKSAPVPPYNPNKLDQDIANEKMKSSHHEESCTKISKDLDNLKINKDDSIREKKCLEENDPFSEEQRHIPKIEPVSPPDEPVAYEHKTVVTYQVHQCNIPNPKQTDQIDKRIPPTVKSQNISNSAEDYVRKKDSVNRVTKPEVPARPLSLTKKSPADVDSVLKKTHCSVFNVADKLQPSIINIQTKKDPLLSKNESKEKENFLEAECDKDVKESCNVNPSSHNKYTTASENKPITLSTAALIELSDINKTKSNEQLNLNLQEKTDGSPKQIHTRARSDGGVIDLEKTTRKNSLRRSSRNLAKPNCPPPPPPVSATSQRPHPPPSPGPNHPPPPPPSPGQIQRPPPLSSPGPNNPPPPPPSPGPNNRQPTLSSPGL